MEYVDDIAKHLAHYPNQCNGNDASEYIKVVQILITILLLTQVRADGNFLFS